MLYKPRNFPTKINFVLSGSFRYKRRPKKEFFLKKIALGIRLHRTHIFGLFVRTSTLMKFSNAVKYISRNLFVYSKKSYIVKYSEAQSEPCQTSKLEALTKIVDG